MTLAMDQAVLVRAGQHVLQGVSMQVAAGEIVGLLGANGAGKSSMLGVLAGDVKLQAGTATLAGQPLASLPFAQLARRRAVLVQQPALQFDLSVAEIVAMGAYPFPELSATEVAAQVAQALAMTGLHATSARPYLDLSGGEQQRVHYARALVQCRAGRQAGDARFLLLDEPTANQDPAQQQHVLAVAARLARDEGMGVLAVLHDINLAARWCDRILLLAEGALIGAGSPDQALTPDRLLRAYGVEMAVVPHPIHAGRLLVMMR
ncbi:MAG: heme ABC transporter ATP-binding protein [Comamonadaceae bacterium]|nr:MAG: heme ABC transporter ATP-binding protein [Comamonadaceae bacterium]